MLFLGLLPMEVGVKIMSASILLLTSIMLLSCIWELFKVPLNFIIVQMVVIVFMASTWILAFLGNYKRSHKLLKVASNLWTAFLIGWIAMSIWTIFLKDITKLNDGLMCSNNRCLMTMLIMNHNTSCSVDKPPKNTNVATRPLEPLQDTLDSKNVKNIEPPIRIMIHENPDDLAITASMRDSMPTARTVLQQIVTSKTKTNIKLPTAAVPAKTPEATISSSAVFKRMKHGVKKTEVIENTTPSKLHCYCKGAARLTSSNTIDVYIDQYVRNGQKSELKELWESRKSEIDDYGNSAGRPSDDTTPSSRDNGNGRAIIVVAKDVHWTVVIFPFALFAIFMFGLSTINHYREELVADVLGT